MVLSLFSLQRRIIGLVLLFLLIGQIMLFSATGVMGLQEHGTEFYYVLRQGIAAAIGLGGLFVLSRVRYQTWRRLAYPLFFLQVALLVATLFTHLGHFAQGASRWIRIGGVGFQPSELAKITVTVYVAKLLSQFEATKPPLKAYIVHGGLLGFALLLVFKQPDLGSTVLLCAVILGLLFIAGLKVTYVLGISTVGCAAAVMAMLHSDYRRRRLMAFLNPWADPQGSGFQAIQSLLSFHSGKWFGVGIGNGNSKLFFLPEVHTDFIFALIGEELGFIGAALVLGLFLYFLYLLFKASLRAPDSFGRYLGFGLSISLALQIAVNLGGVTGLVPVKGLPLPFISWGRSALLVNIAMIGILLNIVRQSAIIATSESQPE